LNNYDNIYLGAQVWASKPSPAINSYIDSGDFKGKNVYLFITLADDKIPQMAIDIIGKSIEKRGGKLIDSITIRTVMNSVITPEDLGDSLINWVGNHTGTKA
jgi:flavodoxin